MHQCGTVKLIRTSAVFAYASQQVAVAVGGCSLSVRTSCIQEVMIACISLSSIVCMIEVMHNNMHNYVFRIIICTFLSCHRVIT